MANNLEENQNGLNTQTAPQTINRSSIIGSTGNAGGVTGTNTNNLNTGAAGTTATGGAGSAAGNANAGGNYGGVQGVSPQTGANLQQISSGYAPSAAVQQALSNLQSISGQRPGEYQSKYQSQLDDIYGQVMGRGPFQYDINKDQLYQQAREQYIRGGQQAMMDTMGNAASLTGGYGSSYASIAGNQAYQQYLTGLNDKLGDYYDRAYNRYQNEGEDLMNRYGLAMNADATAYGRYQDQLNQWNTDRQYGMSEYSTLAGIDQNQYNTNAGVALDVANLENGSYKDQRDFAANMVTNAIDKGVLPSASMLAQAGLTEADVYAMIYGEEAAAQRGYPTGMPGTGGAVAAQGGGSDVGTTGGNGNGSGTNKGGNKAQSGSGVTTNDLWYIRNL